MKTTTMFLNLANPRRTTLVHLKDAEEIQAAPHLPEHPVELPASTANPKRTILMEKPQ